MILLGKPVVAKIYQNLENDIRELREKKVVPSLGVVLVGEDPASLSYVKMKEKIANRLGIDFQLFHLPGIVPEKTVENLIQDLNLNKYISGIIIQLPLPDNFKTEKILKKVLSAKDIDGFYGNFHPPTAQAILEILKFYGISLKDKKIVIVGHGRLVGKPLKKILVSQSLKPIICDFKTTNLKTLTKSADIIITATGVPALIKPDMVNKNAVIIDAGAAEAGGKIAGDVDPIVYTKIKAYSPVPGGVGPVTVAMLMKNVVEAAKI